VIRALRWHLWRLIAAARLRRLGGRLVVEAASTPRLEGPLRLEPGPRPGTLTLRLGREVRIGRDCVLDLADRVDGLIELADGALLQSRVRLQPWGGAIRIGEHTQVRDGCELKSRGELRIGARVVCARLGTLHCHEAITIGDDVALGDRVSITDSDHANDGSGTPLLQQPVVAEPVEIGRNVLCATNVVVLKGTRIGADTFVAAGAVLTGGEHPSGWLIGGIPAKPLKQLGVGALDDPTVPLR
jgi:acetyltransferase-like isoleucine patch superfamily enzyme